jgi:ABC-type uncharacterized transport system fused permease/ATPase subunit
VLFNYLGRDFFNALSARDVDAFQTQLLRYLGGFAVGVPVFVVKRYFQVGQSGVFGRDWRVQATGAPACSCIFCTRKFTACG